MALPILFSFFPRSPRKIKVGWHIYNSVPRTITHCHTHGRRAHLLHEKATPPRMDVGRNIIRPLREPLHRANEGSQMCHGNGVARSSSTYSPSPHCILHHHERFIFWCVKSVGDRKDISVAFRPKISAEIRQKHFLFLFGLSAFLQKQPVSAERLHFGRNGLFWLAFLPKMV